MPNYASIDTFNRTRILENAKNLHKMAYIKLISAQLPFPRAFAYFTKVNQKYRVLL